MKLENKLTMIISSCDKYSDLWAPHVELLNENWENRIIKTLIVTDKECKKEFNNVDVYSTDKDLEMPQRIKQCLETINTEYVLLTLDDYFLVKPVDTKQIFEYVKVMDEHKLDYFRFWKYPHEKTKIKGFEKLYKINLDGNYKVNLYPAIWRKSFLEKTLENPLNAWEYEVTLTQIAKTLNARCVYTKKNVFPILDVIRKGKLLHPANRYLLSKGIKLDRELISRKQEIKLNIMYYAKEIIPKRILVIIKNKMIKKGHKFISKGM